jgi:uncharacterized protein Yka (UPF0111/DUF47 family)
MQLEQIISSAIVGSLALAGVVYQSRKSRNINTKEHEQNSEKLSEIAHNVTKISDKVDDVSDRLTEHIEEHHNRKRWWEK